MFGLIGDVVEGALDLVDDVIPMNRGTKRQAAQLVEAGVEIASIASMLGISVGAVEELMNSED